MYDERIPDSDTEAEEDEDDDYGDSFVNVTVKDSLTMLKDSQGQTTVEMLISNVTSLLESLGAGKLAPQDVERLEKITHEILQGATTVASAVNDVAPEDELIADAGKKRSALLIEALINQTVEDALEDIGRSTRETRKTSSELIGDLIGYTLNEAVDDSKNVDERHLAQHDSMIIGQHLGDIIQKAVDDIEHLKMSSESIMVSNMIRTTMVSVATDIRTGLFSKASLENLAMSIVRFHDTVKDVDAESTTRSLQNMRKDLKAKEYVQTVLLKVVEEIDKNTYSGNEIASMADRMCSSVYGKTDDGGFKRLHSPASVSVMSAFVKDVINNCLNQLIIDTAEKIVTRMLSEAALSSKSSTAVNDFIKGVAAATTNQIKDSTKSSSNYALETFVQNVINTSLNDSDDLDLDEGEKPCAYVFGEVSETVIRAFIENVLAGSFSDITPGSKPKKAPVPKASIRNLVVDSFLKKVMDCAMQRCQMDSNVGLSADNSDENVDSDIIENFTQEVLAKGSMLVDLSASDDALIALAKQISSSVLAQAKKKRSYQVNFGQDVQKLPNDASSGDLLSADKSSHSRVFTDESSDEEVVRVEEEPLEVRIEPVLKNKHININPEEIAPALSAISMRSTLPGHLAHRFEATKRNSFCSLMHPDLSRIRGLGKGSTDEVKQRLHEAYVQSMSRLSKDTVVCGEAMCHQPGHESEDEDDSSSSSEEDNDDDQITSMNDCSKAIPSPTNDDTEDNTEPASLQSVKSKSASLGNVSPVMSKSGVKSTCLTRTPKQSTSGLGNVSKAKSNELKGKSSTSASKVKGTSLGSLAQTTSSGSKMPVKGTSSGQAGGLTKNESPTRRKSDGSKIYVSKAASGTAAVTSSSGKQAVGQKSTSKSSTKTPSKHSSNASVQKQVTPKSSKKSITSNLSSGSASKVKLKASAGSSAKVPSRVSSTETERVNPVTSTSTRKSSVTVTASPVHSGIKATLSNSTKQSSGTGVQSKRSGRVGPAETGSINDMRAEKELKKALSGQVTLQSGLASSNNKRISPAQKTSDSKLLTKRSSQVQQTFASTSGQLGGGRKTPSDSALQTSSSSPLENDEPAVLTDVPRVLSEGEVVKVKSLYGSFSSTLQVRSNTDVGGTKPSGSQVNVKSSTHVAPKMSGSGN